MDQTNARTKQSENEKGGFFAQLSKYMGVSFTQTFVELGVFGVLAGLGLSSGIANIASVACSGAYNFIMNRNVTFKASSNFTRSVALFVLLYAWNMAFGNIMLSLLPGIWGWPAAAVKLFCMGCQGVWGFLLCKYVIFK